MSDERGPPRGVVDHQAMRPTRTRPTKSFPPTPPPVATPDIGIIVVLRAISSSLVCASFDVTKFAAHSCAAELPNLRPSAELSLNLRH